MPEQSLPTVPRATSPVAEWAEYLSAAIAWESRCRVRLDRLEETPQSREQKLLARLTETARQGFNRPALAMPLASLQKQALQLLQMRRQVVPDDSDNGLNSQVFLAVGELHRAVHQLLDQMEQTLAGHQQAQELIEHWLDSVRQTVQGRLKHSDDLLALVRSMRNQAADERFVLADWMATLGRVVQYEHNQRPAFQQRALFESLLGGMACARLLRTSQWLIDTEAFLIACLLKDVAWFIPHASEKLLSRGQHAEWSAGLLAQAGNLSETVPRLIRQHHECLDGTGLPFGISAALQRSDSRLLAVVSRWTDLTTQQLIATRNTPATGTLAMDDRMEIASVLNQETRSGRWDQKWVADLLRAAAFPLPEELRSLDEVPRPGNPHWKIPRPKYLKKQFPVLPAKTKKQQ